MLKIGTQLVQCVQDLYHGKVDMEQVVVVFDYSGYNFEHSDDWEECWSYYSQQMQGWYGLDKDRVFNIVDDLVFHRKLHRYGNNPPPAWRFAWMDLIVPNEYLDEIPQLRQLWEEYCLLAKLSMPADKY